MAKLGLQMTSINGAQAIKWKTPTGMLTKNYAAGITIFNPNSIDVVPYNDPYNLVAYHLRPEHVSTVLVDGHIILKEGQFRNIDEQRIYNKARKLSEKLFSKFYP